MGMLVIAVIAASAGPGAGRAAHARQVEASAPLRDTLPPSAAVTMETYRALESWVRAWEAPDEAQRVDPEGTTGACVTLRLAGKVIGRATFMAEDGTAVWQAARRAWREAAGNLGVEKDALRAERTREAAARVMIDLQLSGMLTPTTAATFAEAEDGLSPGLDGVAARVGEEIEGFFAGEMLATNATPGRALQALAGRLNLPPIELGQLREKHGLQAYRFRSTHLAQPRAGEAPVFLTRGGRVVSAAEVTGSALRELAGRIAGHIQSHRWPGEEPHGLMGAYAPLLDSYEPKIAGAREQALAALALTRFARTPGIDPQRGREALTFAQQVIKQMTVVTPDETGPLVTAVDAAAWLAAWSELPAEERGTPELTAFATRAAEVIKATWEDRDGWSVKTPAVGRALIALAMARGSGVLPEESWLKPAATEAVRGLFRETQSGELVGLMPWLGWAELSLAEGSATVPSDAVLREMRSMVWGHQVKPGERGVDGADLEGGIVFTKGRNQPPTWQGLRAIAMMATMLGDRRLTDETEVPAELASLRRSLRFVMQLTIDEASMHMFRDPERALGGVRVAVWNQITTLDAAALGLLTVCETLRSTEVRATPAPVRPGGKLGELDGPRPVSGRP